MTISSDEYGNLRRLNRDVSTQLDFTASTDDTTLITSKASHKIWVQRIVVTIKTSTTASMTFEDSDATPLYVAKIPGSPGADTHWQFDFGAVGKPLTEAKNLVMNVSATGLAGHLQVEAYMRQSSTVAV